jgi:salicylate hydroxylase
LTEDALDGLISRRRTSLFFGPGCHAVCYPLPYRGRLNVALFLPDGGAWENETGEPVLTRSARQSTRFTALIEAGHGTWGRWPLGTVTTPAWHKGPIGLIGDAAHAMVPFGAQGAAMGIEDAAILAPLLMSEATAEAAFARFESVRRPRVERVARMSGANGRAFHMRWPFAAARDTVLRAQGTRGHLRRLRWLYGYDPFAPGAGQ